MLSEAVRERIEQSRSVKPSAVGEAVVRREALTRRLTKLLGDEGVLIIPTAHDLPPMRDAPVAAQIAFREKTLALTCVASLTRLPQINLPVARIDGCPVGLSLIAGPCCDEALLALADELEAVAPALLSRG
jgi:amidase